MPHAERSSGTRRIGYPELVSAVEATLVKAGFDPEPARLLARNHAGCERDGALSHGIFRIPQYIETLRSGYLDGSARPSVETVSDSFIRVDASNGIAQNALSHASEAIETALERTGAAVVAIRDSHHHSALWPDLEPFADAGRFAISTVTGGVPTVAPAGTHRPVLSTNPFSFAAPVEGSHPFIVDFATSSMSYGDLTLTARSNGTVPPGTGVDRDGRATTDAAAIVDGGNLLPFGGHKGTALAIMVELLASAVTGGAFSFESIRDKPDGARSSRTGQFLMLFDPDRGSSGIDAFPGRTRALIDELRRAGASRLPSDHRYLRRAENDAQGIPITPAIAELLEA